MVTFVAKQFWDRLLSELISLDFFDGNDDKNTGKCLVICITFMDFISGKMSMNFNHLL